MAKHVLAAHPKANVVMIPHAKSAWDGYAHSLEPGAFFKEKTRKVAVLHRGATWKPEPNGRSTDFLPSVKLGTGCGFFCQYCYVERAKPNSYPKIYDDCLGMAKMIAMTLDNLDYWRGRMKQRPPKGAGRDFECHRCDKHKPFITFDLGCDTDCVIDNQITRHPAVDELDAYPGHIIDIMNRVTENVPGAMTSFATKGVDFEPFIADCKNPGRNRIRLSLMPEHHRRVLEMNTATVTQRLDAINTLVDAGFEVHINLSPIVLTKDFSDSYKALFEQIADSLTPQAHAQLAYEVIFLTHSDCMYEPVKARRPEAHAMMAEGPFELQVKPHKSKGPRPVTTYARQDKDIFKTWVKMFVEKYTPQAHIRYMF